MATTYAELALELGHLVDAKNTAYGNSFAKTADFFRLLYPDGLKPEHYGDALLLARMFDKMMRIATSPGAFAEEPYADLVGYGLLGLRKCRGGNARLILPNEDVTRGT